jgi:hypothetical protein
MVPIITDANMKCTFSYKYDKDTCTFTEGVQAFFKFDNAAWKNEFVTTDNPASTTMKVITSAKTHADTLANFQLATQGTTNWGAKIGTILYISQIEFYKLATAVQVVGRKTITKSGDTIKFVAAITPADAKIKDVDWSVDYDTVATIDKATGVLTAVGNGTVTVLAVTKDGSNKRATAVVTITGQVAVPVVSAENSMFYPNPATDRLSFRNATSIRHIEIMNLNGQIIMSVNNLRSSINLSGLPQGMYLVRITNNDNTTSMSKLIKK